MKIKNIIVFLILIQTCNSFSQAPEWLVFDIENSPVPFNNLHDITFDKDGYVVMVFGQDGYNRGGGLVFYDYNDWDVLNTDNSVIPTNQLLEVEIDKNNAIWIGSLGEEGLFKFKDNDIQVFDKTNSPIKNTFIRNLVVDSNNVKWFRNASLSGKDLIYSFDDINWLIIDSSNSFYKRYSEVRTLFVDKQNDKWFGFMGTDCYIARFNNKNWIVYDTIFNTVNDWSSQFCIEEDSVGNIWIGTLKPIIFDGKYWTILYDFPGWGVYSIATESNNDIWILGDSMNVGRLIKYKQGEWTILDSSNSAYNTKGSLIKIDKYGNKLITTSKGLYIFKEGGVVGITDVDEDIKVEQNKILCYPNPTSCIVNLRYRIETAGLVNIFLTDVLGNQTLLKSEYKFPGDYVETFNFNVYPQGIYNVVLQMSDNVFSERVMIVQ
ncbi:MAG: T9SS type A sorting domain-containing protein [bacterium]